MKTQLHPKPSYLMISGKMSREVTSKWRKAWLNNKGRQQKESDQYRRRMKIPSDLALETNTLSERPVKVKLAHKTHGNCRSKKNLEGPYEVLAPGSHILKVSPSTSASEETGKANVTVCNIDIAMFGTQKKRQTTLLVYADHRWSSNSEKLVQERSQSQIKEHTRKLKGDKEMKHRRGDPGSGVSSSRSKIARAMQGRNPKVPNFPALQNQPEFANPDSQSELVIPYPNASTSALQVWPSNQM